MINNSKMIHKMIKKITYQNFKTQIKFSIRRKNWLDGIKKNNKKQ
jgi:hypothetical protein